MDKLKVVIGIDQSYTKTGISIGINGKLKKVGSIDFKGLKTKSEKRNELRRVLRSWLTKATQMGADISIRCERIRTVSPSQFGNKKGKRDFGIRPAYLIMTGALIGTIVDTAAEFGVEVYSVDTRSWKSKIVGTSKARGKDTKINTVEYVESLGIDLFVRVNKNGKEIYDDDAADSACLCLYGFLPAKEQLLKLEE